LPPGIAGGPEPLHAATFLVNEDGCIAPPDGGPEFIRQPLQLLRRLAVAAEEDQAKGIGALEELDFAGAQFRAAAA
jgi:hypothetical protein